MVVICAREDDAHACTVAEILRARHAEEVFIFDTSGLATSASLTAGLGGVDVGCCLCVGNDHRVRLDQATSFWWRRPQLITIDPQVEDPEVREFAYHECISGLYGVLACCGALWVNNPHNDAAAESKLRQLKVSEELGFRIPRTLATSDPQRAVEFWQQEEHRAVYKAFNERGLAWRPTRMLTEADLAMIDNVRHAPVIFQSYVPGIRDVRVTVVGGEIFATEFDLEGFSEVDYRVGMGELACRSHDLPRDMEDRVRALMRVLRLEYAGIDFRLTADSEYVFFEANTAGEFLYVEKRTGQPIAAAMAAHLAAGRSVHCDSAPTT
jgi:hypothetical protein